MATLVQKLQQAGWGMMADNVLHRKLPGQINVTLAEIADYCAERNYATPERLIRAEIAERNES
jgi:hypothetical protein